MGKGCALSEALVSVGCCNKTAQTGWLKQQAFFLTVLEDGKSKSQVPAGSVADESFLPDYRQLSSCCISSSSQRALIPLWGSALMTSFTPYYPRGPSSSYHHSGASIRHYCPPAPVHGGRSLHVSAWLLRIQHLFLGAQESFHHPQATWIQGFLQGYRRPLLSGPLSGHCLSWVSCPPLGSGTRPLGFHQCFSPSASPKRHQTHSPQWEH